MSSTYGPAGSGVGLQGTGYKQVNTQTFTPEQMQMLQELYPMIGKGSDLYNLASGDQGAFEQMEAPAKRQFGELQGDIASRFSQGGGQGSLGARRSSGFNIAQNSAASQFAQDLQANRQNIKRQALQDLMSSSNMLMQQRPFESYFQPEEQESQGNFGKIMSMLLPLLGAGTGGIFGGPGGAALGGQIGSAASRSFQ